MRTILRTLAATTALFAIAPGQRALGALSAKPDASGLPGSNQLEQIVNGLFFWALLASLAGLFISIATYAVANRMGNHHYAQNGKVGILLMGPLAMIAGAGPAIINFFADLGHQV
jgi:Family of unknown function (DUF6112)